METEEQRKARVSSENFRCLWVLLMYLSIVGAVVISAIARHH